MRNELLTGDILTCPSRAEVRATGVAVIPEALPSQARCLGNRVHAGALFLRFRHNMSVADDVEHEKDQEEGDEDFIAGMQSYQRLRLSC